MIEKGKEYRIKGVSQYFLRKYGTCNPLIRVEGTDKEIWPGSNWLIQAQNGNWAAKLFMERMLKERDQLPTYVDTIWYGHVHGKGECVLESELEEIKRGKTPEELYGSKDPYGLGFQNTEDHR